MQYLRYFSFLILISTFLSACSINGQDKKPNYKAFISQAEEIRVGKKLYPGVLREFGGIYPNPKLSKYVSEIGQKLINAAGISDIKYSFFVLNSPITNAFSLPGGYVFICRGMLAILNTEAELAGILSHEIAHVEARHYAERTSYSLLARGLSLRTGNDGSIILEKDLATKGDAATYLKSFARQNEYEADQIGMGYLVRAGYPPEGMSSFLERIEAFILFKKSISGSKSQNSLPEFFSTHPRTHKRIAEVGRKKNSYGERGKPRFSRVYLENIDGTHIDNNVTNDSLKIKIKTVRPGDTVRSLSNHSSISVGLEKWFRALNGLEDDDNLIVGQTVKLIVR